MMVRVLDKLWQGDKDAVISLAGEKALVEKGITHVLNMATEVDYRYPIPQHIDVLKIPTIDGVVMADEDIEKAIEYITKAITRENGKVLVHCAGGQSRSAGAVIAYLISVGFDYADAESLVKTSNPSANPASQIRDSILSYFDIDTKPMDPNLFRKTFKRKGTWE